MLITTSPLFSSQACDKKSSSTFFIPIMSLISLLSLSKYLAAEVMAKHETPGKKCLTLFTDMIIRFVFLSKKLILRFETIIFFNVPNLQHLVIKIKNVITVKVRQFKKYF